MGPFQTSKLWLVETIGLAKDALHIHVGLILFFIAVAALRRPLTSLAPVGIVLALTCLGEIIDIVEGTRGAVPPNIGASVHDIINTMFWPCAIVILARTTRLFTRAPESDASSDRV